MNIRKRAFRGASFSNVITDLHASDFTFDDEQEVRDRWWHVQPGDFVLDVGGAFGSYTLPAIALGARVVVFSPADFDTDLLTQNLDLNPGFRERCEIVRVGIHGRAGWFDPDSSRMLTDEEAKDFGDHGRAHAIPAALPVTSLDDWFASWAGSTDRIDWLKMDIEGAEVHALHGGEQLIRRFRPNLLIENHQFHNSATEGEVIAFVQGLGLGYSVETRPHHSVSHSFFSRPHA